MSVLGQTSTWLDVLVQDLKFAVRGLRRDWTFTLTAVAMLTVGVALNVAVTMIVNTLLFRGSPLVKENDRLVYIQEAFQPGGCCISYHDMTVWRSEARSLQGIGYMAERPLTLRRDNGRPLEATAGVVSANTFGLLQVQPFLGRDFTPADEVPGAPAVALLSHRVWQTEFGTRPDIVGSTVHLDGVATTVIGVMPEGFTFPVQEDLWIPVVETPQIRQRGDTPGSFVAFGRLRDGARLEDTRTELEAINARLATAYPDTNRGVTPIVRTHSQLFVGDNARNVFTAIWVGAWFVLLIGCVNVANLTLVRTNARWGECSTRIALGAQIGRIVRPLVLENLLLASVAAALGWWIATWGLRRWASITASRYQVLDYGIGSSAVAYLLMVLLLAAFLCSLAPIIRIVRHGSRGLLKDEPRGATSGRLGRSLTTSLVAAQMGLAMVLFTGTGVLGRSYMSIVYADTGVGEPERVLTAALSLPADRYSTPQARLQYFDRLDGQMRSISGVEGVTLGTRLPVEGLNRLAFEIDGRRRAPGGSDAVQMLAVGPQYFQVLGAPVIEGREFASDDRLGGPSVALVNRSFANQFVPGGQIVGRRLRVISARGEPGGWRTIVGIVGDIMQGDATRQAFQPMVYIPSLQAPPQRVFVLMRTNRPSDEVARAALTRLQEMDPEVTVRPFSTLSQQFAFDRDRMDGEHSELGKYVAIAPVMTLTALPLAALGLLAVVAHSVSQRTREIGVRLAIGASARDVGRMVLREGMAPVVAGTLVGFAASLAINRVLQSQLVGVSPYDPATMIGGTVVLLVVALLACLLPVRSAIHVEPAVALRHD
jgi:putative ABC transport system permease protein